MKFMKGALALAGVFAMLAVLAETREFSRYQTILDRHPFGPEPPGFDPNVNPNEVSKSEVAPGAAGVELTPEQEVLSKSLVFSVLNTEPDGTIFVGFSDVTDAKSPRHYYLAVGDSQDGWTVKEVDTENDSVIFVKNGIELPLSLGSKSQPSGGAKGKAASGGARSPLIGNAKPSSRAGRKQRKEMEAAAAEAEKAARAEEARKEEAEREAREAEEKAQREAEREQSRAQLLEMKEQIRRTQEQLKQAREDSEAAESDEPRQEAE